MAGILVLADRAGANFKSATPALVGQARHIANTLGATLYVAFLDGEEETDELISTCGCLGADKIVLVRADTEDVTLLAPGLAEVVTSLRPRLVLLPRTLPFSILAQALALSLGGPLLHNAVIEVSARGVKLVGSSPDRNMSLTYEVLQSERPAVATVATAGLPAGRGTDDADVIFFRARNHDLSLTPDRSTTSEADLETDVLVTVGAGALPYLPTAQELARALGATLGLTWTAAKESGLDHPIVDVRGHFVRPRLNIVCGASGSDSHLQAIDSLSTIVALNRDPLCASVRAARYALLGDLASTLGELRAQVSASEASA